MSAVNVKIRPVQPKDFIKSVWFWANLMDVFKDERKKLDRARKFIFDLDREAERGTGLVADVAGGAQGYASYDYDGDWTRLDYLFVNPNFRGMGIGRELVREVSERALASGVEKMYWHLPFKGKEAARAFYLKIGAENSSSNPDRMEARDLNQFWYNLA